MKKLELIYAEYFCIIRYNNTETVIKRDVTKLLKDKVSGKTTFTFLIKNERLGGELKGAEGKAKNLYLKYFYNEREFETVGDEWSWIQIPSKKIN